MIHSLTHSLHSTPLHSTPLHSLSLSLSLSTPPNPRLEGYPDLLFARGVPRPPEGYPGLPFRGVPRPPVAACYNTTNKYLQMADENFLQQIVCIGALGATTLGLDGQAVVEERTPPSTPLKARSCQLFISFLELICANDIPRRLLANC